MNNEELLYQIEAAATSLLTDSEIITSLGITQEVLAEHYAIVERARLKLKQRLNAKRIQDAATSGDAGEIVEAIPRNNKQKISSRGGARVGGGRPKGSTNKISIKSLLEAIERETGDSLENLLAQGYAEAIQSQNNTLRQHYEKLFMNKVVADQVDINIGQTEDVIRAKEMAFKEALESMVGKDIPKPPVH